MKLIQTFSIIFLLSGFSPKNDTVLAFKTPVHIYASLSENETQHFLSDSLRFYSRKFNALNTQVRDGNISELKARKEVAVLLPFIKRYYFNLKNSKATDKKAFPVAGYNFKAIGGTNGSGYLPNGYNYYHGNKHKGHPAHDIFVHDKNHDSLDDKTKSAIKIVSVTNGVVIATETKWSVKSLLRGGNYVWIYNPEEELLYYYAHNQEILVNPGDVIKAGQQIAIMGRSGLNAHKERSPTHLHFMTLKVKPNGALQPVDLYQELMKL